MGFWCEIGGLLLFWHYYNLKSLINNLVVLYLLKTQWYILRERLQWSKWVGVQVYIHNSVFMWVLVYVNSKQLSPSLLSQFPFLSLQVHRHLQRSSLQGSWESSASSWRPLWWQWSLLLPVSTFLKNCKGTYHFTDGQCC